MLLVWLKIEEVREEALPQFPMTHNKKTDIKALISMKWRNILCVEVVRSTIYKMFKGYLKMKHL